MAAKNSTASSLTEDQKTLITILGLLFVFPGGVILMWLWAKWPVWLKILITIIPIIFMLFTFGLIGFIFSQIPASAWHTTTTYSTN